MEWLAGVGFLAFFPLGMWAGSVVYDWWAERRLERRMREYEEMLRELHDGFSGIIDRTDRAVGGD